MYMEEGPNTNTHRFILVKLGGVNSVQCVAESDGFRYFTVYSRGELRLQNDLDLLHTPFNSKVADNVGVMEIIGEKECRSSAILQAFLQL